MRKQLIQCSGSDYISAETAGAGPHVHDVIGGAHHIRVVLDDQNRIPQIAQAAEKGYQPLCILRMQSCCGLIQNIDHAGQLRSQDCGKLQPLQLSAGQGGNCPAAGQVSKSKPADALQLCRKIRKVVLHQLSVRSGKGGFQPADPLRKLIQK